MDQRMGPGQSSLWRLSACGGHVVDLFDRAADRCAGLIWHRYVFNGVSPGLATPPAWHCHRDAGSYPLYYLRYVGAICFCPPLSTFVQPYLIDWFAGIPVLDAVFAGPPFGIGLFTAGLILSIMITPFITAVMRDVFEAVPPMLKESAYGLGSTTWEVMWKVVLPFTRNGVIGGIMLGLGRALGETMAVTFVIGNAFQLPASLFSPSNSIASALANEFNEAGGLQK